MRKRIEERTRLICSIALAITLAAYLSTAHAETTRSISKVNGSIELDSGELADRVHTVNGGVRLRDGAEAGDVSTVNGGIYLEDNTRVDSASTVNGGIRTGDEVYVRETLETVNGTIKVQNGSEIGAGISTVNGTIDLREVRVTGDISTRNGDILILDGSTVEGDIIFESRHSSLFSAFNWFSRNHRPALEIDADASVDGTIHLYQEVELRLHGRESEMDIVRHY